MSASIPSQAEKHALVDAAATLEDHGIEVRFPWECTLDDREKEIHDGFVAACRKYSMVLLAWWMMDNGYATGHGDTLREMLVELEGQARERGAVKR